MENGHLLMEQCLFEVSDRIVELCTEGCQKFPPYYTFLQITVTSLIFNQFLQILAYFVYGDA